MKASKWISDLQTLIDKYGDLEVRIDSGLEDCMDIKVYPPYQPEIDNAFLISEEDVYSFAHKTRWECQCGRIHSMFFNVCYNCSQNIKDGKIINLDDCKRSKSGYLLLSDGSVDINSVRFDYIYSFNNGLLSAFIKPIGKIGNSKSCSIVTENIEFITLKDNIPLTPQGGIPVEYFENEVIPFINELKEKWQNEEEYDEEEITNGTD